MADTVVIKVKYTEPSGYDYGRREILEIDGIEVMEVGPLSECPEDAILERDLIGPNDFSRLLENFIKQHNGKKVKFETEEINEEEE
nr:hypothetical protein [uncultured Trichococcus sp.]